MNKPLRGIRVLELTHVWSGPLCGQVLADLGAEVIRIENRARLDIHRRGGPYPEGKPGINRSGTWNAQNRGKYACTLDLKTSEGRLLLLDLAAKSDALIENFTPGTLDELGVGFARLREANSRIVLLSLSGYGHTGPHRDSLAYGPMMDAATGLSAATTYDDGIPRAVNGWAADVGGALYGCAALLRALSDEQRTARHLDVSQFEAGVMFLAERLLEQANRGNQGAGDRCNGFAFTVPTRDPERWIAVAARTLPEVEALCELVAGPAATLELVRSIPRLGMHPARGRLGEALTRWASERDRCGALAALERAGVPAVRVSTVDDLLADPDLLRSGAWIDVVHPETGCTRSYGPAIRLHGSPPEGRPAPVLGGDNDYVFGTLLELPAERIADLAARRIF